MLQWYVAAGWVSGAQDCAGEMSPSWQPAEDLKHVLQAQRGKGKVPALKAQTLRGLTCSISKVLSLSPVGT